MALTFLLVVSLPLFAAPRSGAGTAGAAFLKIPASAEAAAMAGAWSALAEGARAIHQNPAGLAHLDGRGEAVFSHAKWLGDLTHQSAAAAFTSQRLAGVLGIGFVRLGTDQKGYDEQDRPTGGFSTSDMALSLGYARGLEISPERAFKDARFLHVGGAVKLIRQEVPGASATGFAADFGAQGTLRSTPFGALRVSVSGSNLGPGLELGGRASPLPRRLALGAAYGFREQGLTASLEAVHLADEGFVPALAVSWSPVQLFTLRAGWRAGVDGEDALGALGFGAGLNLGRLAMDAAFAKREGLGDTLRIEVRWGWGGGNE